MKNALYFVIPALALGIATDAAEASWLSQKAYCVIFRPRPEEDNREPRLVFKPIHARTHTIADARGRAMSNGRSVDVRRGGCTKWKRRYPNS